MRKIIFHIPNKIDSDLASGSQIRPLKMLHAFESIGYEVDVVMGYAAERKKRIKKIKEKIETGVKYDFLYSESSTTPTALTEKHHLPVAPFLDFSFFHFCKKRHIKIGLFYRDIYWNFDIYRKKLSPLKVKLATAFYKYDLRQYGRLLDILYLPSIEMLKYVPLKTSINTKPLPPAITQNSIDINTAFDKPVFIYVGGISEIYDLTLFCKVNHKRNGTFNLCVRKEEWLMHIGKYRAYLDHLTIHHTKGQDLQKIYNKSSVAVYFIKPSTIWNFAMGVKLFEYISQKKPIIAVKGTSIGDFVEENNIGWTIDYSQVALEETIEMLEKHPSAVKEKISNIDKITPENTWEARARQVIKDLT